MRETFQRRIDVTEATTTTEAADVANSGSSHCSDAILPEQTIIEYHTEIGADFGSSTPVRVVVEGLLKVACGWANGSTCNSILRHHELIEGKHGETVRLTRRGQKFLWERMKASN
tara:strand:+ start:1041 stop:1385 length:345 start_codon:yes stop_codon:yes gene_type:complete